MCRIRCWDITNFRHKNSSEFAAAANSQTILENVRTED
jgi:hypothetical protein